MPCQLPYDCHNYIFEYLNDDDDKNTLYSCLLVNSLCCEIAVRILWRDVWKFCDYDKKHILLSIINTLIAFLPKESKEFLHKNGITIPIQKPPLFNYPSFCKIISTDKIEVMTRRTLEKRQSIISEDLENVKYLSQEILKMFMNQISSLKVLKCNSCYTKDVKFVCSPRAKICLANLTRLECNSGLKSEFFYQISQICHNIQSLYIDFGFNIINGLADLISLQNNLKIVMLRNFKNKLFDKIIHSLVKHSFSLTRLILVECDLNLSFIAMFKNLQVLNLYYQDFNNSNFDQLQYIRFLKLKILKFIFRRDLNYSSHHYKMLINFLEINGKILTQLYIYGYHNDSLNIALSKFCPNLKNLCTLFKKNESETLKLILNNCQYLEIIKVRYGDEWFNGKTIFKVLANYSQKYFYGLNLNCYYSKIVDKLHEELEEFFINWQDHISQRSLSLIINTGYSKNVISEVYGKGMKTTIDKYMKLGIIKKFETEECGFIDQYSEFRTSI
ncbi:hypothetical protein RhiirA4_464276 [Rhizophagus irregularis]|uniref:F-box domain-containing protein n=1 Tax=Rhizophagus irregularis TaxID=588596 RepID=A0A2I1GPR0_9GLOM|nr:hypothetical protein RhiirA4_464276 [Rhizophagus irregularis]